MAANPKEVDPHAEVREEAIKTVNRLTMVVVILAVMVVASFLVNLSLTNNVSDRVTVFEQSPCVKAIQSEKPFTETDAGKQCDKLRRSILKVESIRNQCLVFDRVGLPPPPKCRFHSDQNHGENPSSGQGGGSQQSPPATQQPTPGDGGSTGGGSNGGGNTGTGNTGGNTGNTGGTDNPPPQTPQNPSDVSIHAGGVGADVNIPCVQTPAGVTVGCKK